MADKDMTKTKKAAGILTSIQSLIGFADNTHVAIDNIQKKGERFQNIVNRELEISRASSGGSFLNFAQSLRSEKEKNQGGFASGRTELSIREQLQESSNDLYSFFQDAYQNKYIEISDLQFISKFIPALGESVSTVLDSIVSSDQWSDTISRKITYDSSVPVALVQSADAIIKKLEIEHDIPKMLKNVVFKTTLVSGKYYIYAISYQDLFSNFERDQKRQIESRNSIGGRAAHISEPAGIRKRKATESDEGDLYGLSYALESDIGVASSTRETPIDMKSLEKAITEGVSDIDQKRRQTICSYVKNHISSVKVIESEIPEDILRETYPMYQALTESVNDPAYKGIYDKFFGETKVSYTDSLDPGVQSTDKRKSNRYVKDWGVHGTYIRYIEPKKIVPVKLMNQTIGYFNIISDTKTQKTLGQTNGSGVMDPHNGVFNAVSLSEAERNAIVDNIVGSITNEIIARFNKPFIVKNAAFKKAIADCITYNGYMDNEYKIQFIPAEDIIEFVVDPDEDGNGKSILANSLFPAKLLLSLRVARILNYLNKSGDKTISYIHKGVVDVDTGNQIQRVIRNLQETNITFSDLLSTNLVFNKFGRNQNIMMPTSRDDKRLVEFETQEGMNVDMNPEYEQQLERDVIMGAGVPSVIMEYIGQADFAKGFETANIRYVAKVSSYQADLEVPTTELYNRLIQNSDLPDADKQILNHKIHYRLNRPKMLQNNNSSEYLGVLQQISETISNLVFGQSSDNPYMQKVKERFALKLAAENAPFFDWDHIQELANQTKLEVDSLKEQTGDTASSGDSFNY